jgi:hypothetical protein
MALRDDSVPETVRVGHLPISSSDQLPENHAATSELDAVLPYEKDRYAGLGLDKIIATLRGQNLTLLKRGTIGALIARRERGGLFVAAAELVSSRQEQVRLFRRIVDLDYSEARKHMRVWLFWERIAKMLSDREESCRKRGVPFVVPGYRRCLEIIGIERKPDPLYEPPPAPPEPPPLPNDVVALTEMVKQLEMKIRLQRADKAHLLVELDIARDELRSVTADRGDEQSKGIAGKFTGWLRRRRALPTPPPDRAGELEVRPGHCLDRTETEPNIFDAVVTDGPYELGLHGKAWDTGDISFSAALWDRFMLVLKPGGYVAFFAAPRLYHHAAMAAEKAGFIIHPFLSWRFRDGLAKPMNLSELFDRENLDQREIIGVRRGSGFTQANVDQGAQNRTHTSFTAYARYVSEEAQNWRGYYYGRNALKPCIEPILLAQKPIETGRMIDNVRRWGTGALNVGALLDQYNFWPSTMLTHRKTSKAEHQTDHPSVKPITLMEDICTLVCPTGGRILDPFAGTGTTGIAAHRRGFDCVLIEQDAAMCAAMEERIARET